MAEEEADEEEEAAVGDAEVDDLYAAEWQRAFGDDSDEVEIDSFNAEWERAFGEKIGGNSTYDDSESDSGYGYSMVAIGGGLIGLVGGIYVV